jgi:hypothetical protein
MGEFISLTEATRRFRVGEKTLRKWLRAANMGEKKPDDQGRMQWQIDSEDLERLVRQKQTAGVVPGSLPVYTTSGHLDASSPETTEQITALASELSYQGEILEALKQGLDALQQEMEVLRTRVTALEQGSRTRGKGRQRVVESIETRVSDTADKPASKRAPTTTSTREDLPTGWHGWTPFIERHNVSAERRAIMRLNRSDYCQPGEYMLDTGKGKTLVKCALSPDGQSRLLTQLWSMEFQSELRPCDVEACPCHEVFPKMLW